MWLWLLINLIFLVLVVKYLVDIGLVLWCSRFYGVPYVPTKMDMVKKVVNKVMMKKGEKLVELGSGDGRVAVEFAKMYPVQVVGYERNLLLLAIARLRYLTTWKKRGVVRFVSGDLSQVSFRGLDVVYMYLLPSVIDRLTPKLEKELKRGARVVSYDYPLRSRHFVRLAEVCGGGKVAGVWERR